MPDFSDSVKTGSSHLLPPFSLLGRSTHPTWAICAASCLLPASDLFVLLSFLKTSPKVYLKDLSCHFSIENFYWYLMVPEMSLKLLILHMTSNLCQAIVPSQGSNLSSSIASQWPHSDTQVSRWLCHFGVGLCKIQSADGLNMKHIRLLPCNITVTFQISRKIP